MAVGDFAAAFERQARLVGIDFIAGVTRPWLSGQGHLDPVVQDSPSEVIRQLSEAFDLLGGNHADSEGKRRTSLRVDFFLEPDTLVELDEFQHFTTARLKTLDLYGGVQHELDIPMYRRLCNRNMAYADKYRAAKPAAGFNFYGGRSAQRAYLDMCRDLLGPANGERVIRIAAPTPHVEAAVSDLKRALAIG